MAEVQNYTYSQPMARPYEEGEVNLLDVLNMIKRRWVWFALVFGTVVTGVGVWTKLQTPIFQADGRLLIKSDTTASDLLGLADKFGALDSASSKSNPVETEIQVLLSPPLLQDVINQLDLKDEEGLPLELEKFEEKVSANEVRGTDVITLKYKDSDPKLAARVVNLLMDLYLNNNLEINRSQSIAARKFIAQQIPRSEAELKSSQSRLRQFKEQYDFIDPEQEVPLIVEDIGDLQSEMIMTRAELKDVKEREIQLRAKLGGISSDEAIASSNVSRSPRLQTNIQELQTAQDELSFAQETLTPNHPDLLALREKVSSLQRNLQPRLSQSSRVAENQNADALEQSVSSGLVDELIGIETQAEGLTERLTELEKAYRAKSSATTKYPQLEEKFTALKLDADIAALSYTGLNEALQRALIAENQNIGNVRILHQAAKPKDPISPRLLMNLLMGGFLGVLLGAFTALMVEAKDLRLRTLEDVRRIYNFTLLGAIPDFSKIIAESKDTRSHNLFVRDRPRSMISETYRMINTNLKFSRSDNLQVIVVSSGMPGEGKSSTLANIALAMAELGNQVILIDSDMRLPSQHQVWELPNRKGLSHVLIENDETFARLPVIPENDNLDIMPAGALPPNPTSLLDSKRFEKLIAALRKRYDYVLIDAPPITVASDALLISQVVDGLILVARPGKLNRAAANVAVNMIRQAQVNILGVIGNGIRPKDETNSTQYYQQEYYGKENLESDIEAQSISKAISSKALSLLGRDK